MAKKNANQVLWENVSNCMLHHWKEINLYRLAKDAKIGTGGAARLKAAKSATRISTLEKVGKLWKLEPWQLLMPDLDPSNPPVFVMSEKEKDLYDRLKRARRAFEEEESRA